MPAAGGMAVAAGARARAAAVAGGAHLPVTPSPPLPPMAPLPSLAPPSPSPPGSIRTALRALQRLDYRTPDPLDRAAGLAALETMPTPLLLPLAMYLVQALRFEERTDSALARFLLRRSLACPMPLGWTVYWYLAAESVTEGSGAQARFQATCAVLAANLGGVRVELGHAGYVQARLLELSCLVQSNAACGKAEMSRVLREGLKKTRLPAQFRLPLKPEFLARGISEEPGRCRVMFSKKKPLWLEMLPAPSNPSARTLAVLFKNGDDLRQDQLVLHMLRVMDALWKEDLGLDACVLSYDCTPTGPGSGLLELVRDSDTIANILTAGLKDIPAGAMRKAAAIQLVYKEDRILEWLRDKCAGRSAGQVWRGGELAGAGAGAGAAGLPPPLPPLGTAMDAAQENFARSAAACCVATYVLGIGDRHADNIMCTEEGRLFHIDFGHILGRFKKKGGFLRERSVFVFTPQMARVLGYSAGGAESPAYRRFLDFGAAAFNTLRRRFDCLDSLFHVMLGCGLPGLASLKDIEWVRGALKLDIGSEEAAAAEWRKMVGSCLTTRFRQIDDSFHMLVHA